MAGSDIKTSRRTATGAASIGRSRIRQVTVTTAATGTPELKITDGNGGATLLHIDLVAGDVFSVNIPAEGILVTDDVYVATFDDITSATVFYN